MSPDPDDPGYAVSTADLGFEYSQTAILEGIDLSLSRGRTLALLGPSGCGKTTLLRLIAGLLQPTAGTISINGKVAAQPAQNIFTPPEKRNLGMVFQDYALWPHLTVGGNVSFPLEMRGIGKGERGQRTARALERVGLSSFIDRRPSDLSGGQQQRVAIARAIVAEPQLILFDEPLSNLDRELRENMVGELAELIASLHLTAVYVTHDHAEALTLADEVAVMRGGQIVQIASPDDLINNPATPDVADFLRLGGLAHVEWQSDSWALAGSGHVIAHNQRNGQTHARILVPTRAITPATNTPGDFQAVVIRSQFRGDGHLAVISPVGLQDLELQLFSRTRFRSGETIPVSVDESQIFWFAADSQATHKERVATC